MMSTSPLHAHLGTQPQGPVTRKRPLRAWANGSAALFVVLSALNAGMSLVLLRVLSGERNPSTEGAEALLGGWYPLAAAASTITPVAALSFVVWFNLSARQVSATNPDQLSFGPRWAVVAWLIPLYNIMFLRTGVEELWRHSYPRSDDRTGQWLPLWWGLYVAGLIAGGLSSFNLGLAPTTAESLADASRSLVVASLCNALAAGTAAHIILSITQRQEKTAPGATEPAWV